MTGRRRAGIALVVVAGAAGAVLSFRAALRPARTATSLASAPQLDTPVWSARRVPTLLVRAVEAAAQARAAEALTTKLEAIVAPVRACVAVDGPGGALTRIGADLPLSPASTLKLLTATTAIDRLGPDHRFTTRAFTEGADLVVFGDGDPLLATPEYIAHRHAQARFRDAPFTRLADLADAIAAAGVRGVSGALLVDDHLHDTLRYLPEWKPGYGQDGDVGSLGALSVDGGFADPSGRSPAPDPALLTGRRLAAMLDARGVAIAGGVRRGRASNRAQEVAHVDSPPLSDIVGEMLTSSDDYTAEVLLRDLAVGAGDAPATTEAGTRIVEQEPARLGVTSAGLVVRDGSGLARDNRATCTTLLQLLEVTMRPRFAAVDKGLAVAARSGTLVDRFVGDPLAGKLRAKTGSLDGVVGLVGLFDRPDRLRFAFLANGEFSTGAGMQLQARVADAVGSTPDLRAPPDLVPPP